jgi:hypothetical protein
MSRSSLEKNGPELRVRPGMGFRLTRDRMDASIARIPQALGAHAPGRTDIAV